MDSGVRSVSFRGYFSIKISWIPTEKLVWKMCDTLKHFIPMQNF